MAIGDINYLGSTTKENILRYETLERNQAFTDLEKVYFFDRGIGRSGITMDMLKLSVVGMIVVALYLVSSSSIGNYLAKTLSEIFLIILFLNAIWQIIKQNSRSRKCFDVFLAINGISESKEAFELYNKGGSPATTSSIWYPKGVWLLSFFPGFSLAWNSIYNILLVPTYHWYWNNPLGADRVIVLVGLILTFISLFIPFKFSKRFWKNVKFFVGNLLTVISGKTRYF